MTLSNRRLSAVFFHFVESGLQRLAAVRRERRRERSVFLTAERLKMLPQTLQRTQSGPALLTTGHMQLRVPPCRAGERAVGEGVHPRLHVPTGFDLRGDFRVVFVCHQLLYPSSFLCVVVQQRVELLS